MLSTPSLLWRSTHNSTGRYISLRRGLATEVQKLDAPQPPKKPPHPNLRTAVVLNRSPILTRTPTSLERAYYAYQARIQRALHNPFPHEFYFKPGSLLESKFNLEERKRDRRAFGPGFGADHPRAPGAGVTAQDLKKFGRDEDETPAPRVHASDDGGDVKSLDRKGQRNLYLVIKQKTDADAVWKFPETASAARDLRELCGEAMDSWIVSRKPIGLYEIHPPTPPTDLAAHPKVRLCRTHHGGQVRPAASVTDFAWLTKKEIAKRVDQQYWDGIKDMLSDF
ncbi:39S mitochondrial ribosomal protein L46-domain-containing protein [Russula brevipes]|nr:39S mitochondrial ribosomal protein L46-domain-containing protein [Russula brevipes]